MAKVDASEIPVHHEWHKIEANISLTWSCWSTFYSPHFLFSTFSFHLDSLIFSFITFIFSVHPSLPEKNFNLLQSYLIVNHINEMPIARKKLSSMIVPRKGFKKDEGSSRRRVVSVTNSNKMVL